MLKRFISAVLCVMLALTSTVAYISDSGSYVVEAAVDYDTPYYYSQMSEDAKKAYNELKAAVLECTGKVKVKASISQEDFDMIAELLILHDPMTFNVADIEANDVTRNSAVFSIKYTYSKETYDKMAAAYEKKVNEILAKLTDDMNRYQKIRIIHDEIIKNTVYDLESSANDTIYGTLVKKKGKCDGYAKTFSYICAKAGIRTVTVIGSAARDGSTEMHMWNKVYYNNKWYNVDTTWDDPVSNLKKNYNYDYFMISDAEISRSHVEDNFSFKVPKADDDSISYYKVNKKCADDLESAKSLIKSGITAAAKNRVPYYEFKCSSKAVFDETVKYANDTKKISELLKSVKKDTGSKLVTSVYSYGFNDEQYTIRFLIFYENTTIGSYFTETDSIDSELIKKLAGFGIK